MTDRRLFVALDMPHVFAASNLVAELGSSVESYKIGLELVMAGGSAVLIDHLRRLKKRIFLDVKLHDIGTTVQRSVAAAADFGGAGRHRVHRCQKLGMTVGISRLRSDSLAFVV